VIEIRVPDIGDFADVPVIELLVAEGDTVAPEDPLVTLESDKATMDVPSPAAGTVTKLLVKVDDRVAEGTVLLELEPSEVEPSEVEPSEVEPSEVEPSDVGPSEVKPSGVEPTPASAPARLTETAPAGTTVGSGETPSSASGVAFSSASGRDTQVVVIGAGPGGYTAAFRAADLGLKTMLIDRDEILGGVCLKVGCIPSKALLHAAKVIADADDMAEHGVSFGAPKVKLAELMEWKSSVVARLTGGLAQMAKARKVEVLTGDAQFRTANSLTVGDREISFDAAIIAVGSRTVSLPFVPEDERVIDSTGALSPTEVPKRMLVIGGGIIGLEMATVYDALGARVTVVEMADQLIPGADPDLVKPLAKRIGSRYSSVLTGTQVSAVKAQKNGLKVEFAGASATADGPSSAIFDRVLVAVGRRPNGDQLELGGSGVSVDPRGFIAVDDQQRTNVPNIFAIGDVVGQPMLAHKATHEAKVAAEVIAGTLAGTDAATLPTFDVRAIPSVAYTDPEVAWMGLTETAAKAAGTPYTKQTFPWSASGRALGFGRPEGFTKLLFEPDSGRLLGAGIVGVGAGDLIAETVHALEMGSTAEDIGLTVHPHPTTSETIAFAAELETGAITDLPQPRRRRS
jgi:dihydrolipoamide dehydrogenase